MALEERTARLTILIDPRKKAVLERLSAEEDLTPSRVVRDASENTSSAEHGANPRKSGKRSI